LIVRIENILGTGKTIKIKNNVYRFHIPLTPPLTPPLFSGTGDPQVVTIIQLSIEYF